jgi:Ca2+-transporting ATPase
MTVFLAVGAWRIAQNNVLTRNPSAIETLGAATVLCADKTGTITQNKMEVVWLYNGEGWWNGADPVGGVESFDRLVRVARKASESRSVDPMDLAVISFCDRWGDEGVGLSLLKEYPLQDDLLAVTRVWGGDTENDLLVATKGAPETIFRLCSMDKEAERKHYLALHKMGEHGLRVLGVASASLIKGDFPDHPSSFTFSFLGLIGFEDPVRPEMNEAMNSCLRAG